MPVIHGQTPTVNVQVPVPTPVPAKKRPPVSFTAPQQPAQPPAPGQVPPPAPVPPQLTSVILPWNPPNPAPSKMGRRGPIRYSTSDHAAFQEAVNNGDRTARKVYADYLDEHPGSAEPWVVHLLRHHEGPMHVRNKDGKVTADFKKTVDPGVVDRKGLPTTIEFKNGRLSMTGRTGQTIMQFREYDPRGHLSIRNVVPRKGWTPKMVRQLHDVWDRWHLNDMKTGTPTQEEYLRTNPPEYVGGQTYVDNTQHLNRAGLNPDPQTGERYGSKWFQEEVPSDVLHFLATLPGPHVPKPRTPKPGPEQMSRLPVRKARVDPVRYSTGSSDVATILKGIRSDPYQTHAHGMLADALDESYPGNKVAELIRQQFGLGQHEGQGEKNDNLYHDPVFNSYDGTHPYAARIGKDGPFNLYLLHEGSPAVTGHPLTRSSQRWVVRANSTLPGSRDTAYNFEFPHELSHLIPRMFPGAAEHIDPDPNARLDHTHSTEYNRNLESSMFNDKMDERERNRG